MIYVGYNSPSIIRFIEPMTSDIFTVWLADYHFDETIFSSLGKGKTSPEEKLERKFSPEEKSEFSWNVTNMTHLDPRTA